MSTDKISRIIEEFLFERKNLKLKTAKTDSEKQKIEEQFALENWLPNAAKRAGQLTIASHPSKFSHPDAKTSSIIAKNRKANDGYLRSGNVEYELDAFGNAASLDVYKFLNLSNGETILSHLENDSEEIKLAFKISTASYEDLKQGFLAIKQSDKVIKTDRLVKQVYFPVDDSYHLLSILTPSGIVAQLKSRIDKIRFSDEAKKSKEHRRKNEFCETGFSDLLNLSIIGYGGTKPQNISTLNNKNGGRAYLFSSIPPANEKRNFKLPTSNFFDNLWLKNFKADFEYLNEIIIDKRNNIKIREYREHLIADAIIGKILKEAENIRKSAKTGWSQEDRYSKLPLEQKKFLDNFYLEERKKDEQWVEEIAKDIGRWIIFSYESLFKEKAQKLGDEELDYIKQEAKNAILTSMEF